MKYVFNPNSFNLPKDAPKYAQELVYELRKHFKDVAMATGGQGGTTTVITPTGAVTSDSGSSTAVTLQYRTAITSVPAGTTFVAFSSPLINPYQLILELYNVDGYLMPQATNSGIVGTSTTSIPQSNAGFSITTEEFLYVKYTAIEIK